MQISGNSWTSFTSRSKLAMFHIFSLCGCNDVSFPDVWLCTDVVPDRAGMGSIIKKHSIASYATSRFPPSVVKALRCLSDWECLWACPAHGQCELRHPILARNNLILTAIATEYCSLARKYLFLLFILFFFLHKSTLLFQRIHASNVECLDFGLGNCLYIFHHIQSVTHSILLFYLY